MIIQFFCVQRGKSYKPTFNIWHLEYYDAGRRVKSDLTSYAQF